MEKMIISFTDSAVQMGDLQRALAYKWVRAADLATYDAVSDALQFIHHTEVK